MKTSHKLFLTSAIALPFIGLAGTAVHAATGSTSTTGTHPMSALVDKIATKFNLKSSDVQAVFDEQRTAQESAMQAKKSDALKTAGFTDAQISALQSKQKEQRDAGKAWYDANPNATQAELKAQRESKKATMDAWAKEQGIDLMKVQDALRTAGVGHMGMLGGHGHSGKMHGAMMNNGDETPPADIPAN